MATTDQDAVEQLESEAEQFRERFARIKAEIGRRIVGYEDVLDSLLIALFSGGHVLLEGVPGLGKTVMVRTLARAMDTTFSRIQFTPDLMPADIIGTNVVFEDPSGGRTFRFQRGPVFAHVVLADEINRATPKTQSALLEAMQEGSVTVGGETHPLDQPFIVLGTQNPIEMEGTYPLPEAQIDRFFFKLNLQFLGEEELVAIVDRTTADTEEEVRAVLTAPDVLAMRRLVRQVAVAEHVKRFAVRIVAATHPAHERAPESVKRNVRFGSSPRGIQTLILAGKARALIHGRVHVSCEDIRVAAPPALRHRVLLNFEGQAEAVRTDDLVDEILRAIPEIDRDGSP